MEAAEVSAPGVTEGRIVHVKKPGYSHCIAAVVVRAWGGDYVNVLLLPDGSNDGYAPTADPNHGAVYGLPWMTSIRLESSPEFMPGNPSWHWPERV